MIILTELPGPMKYGNSKYCARPMIWVWSYLDYSNLLKIKERLGSYAVKCYLDFTIIFPISYS